MYLTLSPQVALERRDAGGRKGEAAEAGVLVSLLPPVAAEHSGCPTPCLASAPGPWDEGDPWGQLLWKPK